MMHDTDVGRSGPVPYDTTMEMMECVDAVVLLSIQNENDKEKKKERDKSEVRM
jgi:hypothetical protein